MIDLTRGPDNIDIAENGDLWIAAHPKALKVGPHGADPSVPSPTEILHVPVGPDGQPGEAETIYLNTDGELSTGSVAAAYKGRVLAGTIYDDALLSCPLAP